jgi:hypothetical protein
MVVVHLAFEADEDLVIRSSSSSHAPMTAGGRVKPMSCPIGEPMKASHNKGNHLTEHRTASSGRLPLWQKLYSYRNLIVGMIRRRSLARPWEDFFRDLAEYERHLKRYSDLGILNAKVLEVGTGPVPYRLAAMVGMGIDAVGVDLDGPIISGLPHEFWTIFLKNGPERAIKSLVRFFLVDRRERKLYRAEIARRGGRFGIPRDRVYIQNASSLSLKFQSLDLVVSESVFEHMTPTDIEHTINRMRDWLRVKGLALIRINVFTGISGGHLPEWQPHKVNWEISRRSEPWEHLRKRRFLPDVYLNRLSMAMYRQIFDSCFEILEEVESTPDLGRHYLTSDVRNQLGGYSDEDLFSNVVLFVMRPKPPVRNGKNISN